MMMVNEKLMVLTKLLMVPLLVMNRLNIYWKKFKKNNDLAQLIIDTSLQHDEKPYQLTKLKRNSFTAKRDY